MHTHEAVKALVATLQAAGEPTLLDIAHLDGRFYRVRVEEITPEQFAQAAEQLANMD